MPRRLLSLATVLLGFLLHRGPEPAARQGSEGFASTAGQLLVATPELGDENFSHTVVLMIEHDRDGALGVILNRTYGRASLRAVLHAMGKDYDAHAREMPFYRGGPVQGDIGFVFYCA